MAQWSDVQIRRREFLATATAIGSSVGIAGCTTVFENERSIANRAEDSSDRWPTLGQNPKNTKFNAGGSGPKEDPSVRWSVERQKVLTPPVVTGDSVVLSGINSLLVLSPDGSQQWGIDHSGYLDEYRRYPFPVTVTDDLVYSSVPGDMGEPTRLVAYSHDGELQWELELESLGGSTPFVTHADNILYITIPSGNSGVLAIDPTNGDIIWSVEIDSLIRVDPVVTENFVLVHAGNDRLTAYDSETGDLEWEFDTLRSRITRPVVVDETVYVQYGNDLVGLDVEDGSTTIESEGRFGGNFAYADGAIFEPRGTTMRCYDLRNDNLLWEQEYRDTLSAPAIADGVVYVGGSDKQIRGLEATTGEELWSHRLDEDVMRPVVAKDRVFVVSDDTLYAFGE